MQNAEPVRFRKSFGGLQGNGHRFRFGQASAAQAIRQRLALHILHGDVGTALEFTGLIDLADVGMVQACGELRLAQQSAAHSLRQLQRNAPPEFLVLGEIHIAHAARSEGT